MSQDPSQGSCLSFWDSESLGPETLEEADPLQTDLQTDISEKSADREMTSPATSLDTVLTATVTTKQWQHLRNRLSDYEMLALRIPKFKPYNPKSYKGNDFLSQLPESLELLDSLGLASAEGNLKRKRSTSVSSEVVNEGTGNLDKDGEDLEFKKVRRE
jgi:hypothetical protein